MTESFAMFPAPVVLEAVRERQRVIENRIQEFNDKHANKIMTRRWFRPRTREEAIAIVKANKSLSWHRPYVPGWLEDLEVLAVNAIDHGVDVSLTGEDIRMLNYRLPSACYVKQLNRVKDPEHCPVP